MAIEINIRYMDSGDDKHPKQLETAGEKPESSFN